MVDHGETAACEQLRDLQFAYARALDDRDPAALLQLFHADAILRTFPPGAEDPSLEGSGHDQLVLMVEFMRQRYEATLHVVSNPTATVAGDHAHGQAYCVAHHLIGEESGSRKVAVYLIYRDVFRREPGDGWKFSQRDIHFLWMEEHPVLTWEEGLVRARLA